MKYTRPDNEAVKEPTIIEAVSPKFEKRPQCDEHNGKRSRALTGRLCSLFFFLPALMFSQTTSADLYDDFSINPSASQDEIEKAWKGRLGSYHPDKHIHGKNGLSEKAANKIFAFLRSERTLQEIEAEDDPELKPYKDLKKGFYVLRDPTLRKQYDEWLKTHDHEEGVRRQSREGEGGFEKARSSGRDTDGNGYSRQTGRAGNFNLLYEAIFSAKRVAFDEGPNERELQELILTILEEDININERNPNGETALYLAAERGYHRTVEILLDAKADPNIPDNNGKTALYRTVEKDYRQIGKTLLHAGADPNIPDNNGKTALHQAVEKGYPQTIRNLLDAKERTPISRITTEIPLFIWPLFILPLKNSDFKVLKALLDCGRRSGHIPDNFRTNGRSPYY